jgi:hypothetical protein
MKSISIFKYIFPSVKKRDRAFALHEYRVVEAGSKHRFAIKLISLVISFVFLFQQAVPAQHPISNVNIKELSRTTIDPENFSVPRDIAITKDLKSTENGKLIINIKDVHDNYRAQVSIVEVLDNLLMNYDIRFVGVEGSEGYIDTSILSEFPDKEAKEITADHLMREGKISAGEFFAAVSDEPVMLYGIDDSELYLKNYKAFLELLEYKKENIGKVKVLKEALYGLEEYVFSEDLRKINRNSILNGSNNKGFTKRWLDILLLGRKNGVELDCCPNIRALMRSMELEKKIDYKATNGEREKILDVLAKKLQRSDLETLVLKSLSYKLGRISKSQYYAYLVYTARGNGVPDTEYPNLVKFCEYVTLYECIDIALLMDEIEEYEEQIREKIYRNKREKELTHLIKDVEILNNLYSVRLTSGQLKYLMDNRNSFEYQRFISFIKKEYDRYRLSLPSGLSETGEIFSKLPRAISFYEAATARNRQMVENTIRDMQECGVNAGAVITGGFHTRGMTDIFRSDDISYLILLPRFTPKSGKRPYITVLTNKTNEYRPYVETGQYKVFYRS